MVNWNNNGASPETRKAYDPYGNPACIRDANSVNDPNGKSTTIAYDSSNTFPRVITNPLLPQTTIQYYGVDGVIADKGLYGEVKSVTDPNGAMVSTEYDTFGRKVLEIQPDDFANSWAFNDAGAAGTQYVSTNNSNGDWSYSYYDGLGRLFRSESRGPDGNTIVKETKYDLRGAVAQSSRPYFKNLETPRWVTFIREPLGRLMQVTHPDTTKRLSCYNNGVKVTVDENGHRKRESRDVNGRLVKVEEYMGVHTGCSTDVLTPYATTTYQYDVPDTLHPSNLLNMILTDTKGNQTKIGYDSLGRKLSLHDPDMGDWSYQFDLNGNLTLQTDAKGQRIRLGFDELNRLRTKDYGADNSAEVTYTYDEPTSTYPLGRLTTMSDESGITKYYYDTRGRTVKTVKTLDGASYTLEASYDGLDRINTLKYPGPDYETVVYEYDKGGNLYKAGNYATFAGYNALGQPGSVTFGNNVKTDYTYYSLNNRLNTITTTSPSQTRLVGLTYGYENKGNINSITDTVNGTLPHTISSQSYSPYPGKAHAFRATTAVEYDANGNMTSDGQRTIAYNLENMPGSINNINFVYDGTGSRVKKITPTYTVTYLDKLYECVGGVCGKYIFAGGQRIALKTAEKTLYYHTDHQGSTVAVTDAATGFQKENIVYYPFGERRSETGTEPVNHKYTSQELDGETGFYNYNARLYDPETGRFITADSIVPDPANPQSLNRYSYVQNNPLNYVDPTGNTEIDVYCYSDTCGGGGGGGGSGGDDDDSYERSIDGQKLAHEAGRVIHQIGKEFGRWGRDIGNFFKGLFGDDDAPPPPYPNSTIYNSNVAMNGYNVSNLRNYSSGERLVSYLGLGSSVTGSALSNLGMIRDPLNSAKFFIAGRAIDAASYILGVAPSQKVNDIGGIATNSLSSALSVLGAGGARAIGTFGLGTVGVFSAGAGLGLTIGTGINHIPVYGTNQNLMQWYGDAISNKLNKYLISR